MNIFTLYTLADVAMSPGATSEIGTSLNWVVNVMLAIGDSSRDISIHICLISIGVAYRDSRFKPYHPASHTR